MFSGDADESLFTFSTLLDRRRGRGPGFYFYLINPYVVARMVTRFVMEVIKEWWQAFLQRAQNYKYRVSARNIRYSFLRGFMSPVLQDLSTYTVLSDVLRGLPAVYVLYAGYDDLAHYAGMDSAEAYHSLYEIDRYFSRIERTLKHAPRPYHIVVLSDHGQSLGHTFEAAYGMTLDILVKSLIKGEIDLIGALDTHEAWDNLNAFLNESINSPTRLAAILRRILASRSSGGVIDVSPERAVVAEVTAEVKEGKVLVLASGCAGLLYFTAASERLTSEQIQATFPDLIFGLIHHPGIGFVMVESSEYGAMVFGKEGVHYLKDGKIEGTDPLKDYGPHAADHLRRESSFENCPDLLVNAAYDPSTQEVHGFENQVSHHGGLGGPQNHPFILHPVELPTAARPLVGAESVHALLRGWRDLVQLKPSCFSSQIEIGES